MAVREDRVTTFLTMVFILWFGSYAYLYVYRFIPLKPLYSYFALFVLWVAAVGYRATKGLSLKKGSPGFTALLLWLSLFLVYGIFEFLRSSQDLVAQQALITLLEAVLLAASMLMLISEPTRLKWAMRVFAVLVLIGVVLNFWDFFIPTFSKVPGRAAGLYVNPTIAGNFLAMAMVAGLQQVPRRLRLPFVLTAGLGVLVTFSRESWIAWGLATLGMGWRGYLGGRRQRLAMAFLATLVFGGFFGILFSGALGSYVANSSVMQYLSPDTAARIGIGGAVLGGASSIDRENLIRDSLRSAAQKPLLGHGLGYTAEWQYPQGTHDMYLRFLVEGGILGLLLYFVLLALLWRYAHGLGRIITLQIIITSFFSHNHLQQPAILFMIAFIIAHGAEERQLAELPERVGNALGNV